jgi:hypothetical protein
MARPLSKRHHVVEKETNSSAVPRRVSEGAVQESTTDPGSMTSGGGASGAGFVAVMERVLRKCFGLSRSTRELVAITGLSLSARVSGRKKGRRRRRRSSATALVFSPVAHQLRILAPKEAGISRLGGRGWLAMAARRREDRDSLRERKRGIFITYLWV